MEVSQSSNRKSAKQMRAEYLEKEKRKEKKKLCYIIYFLFLQSLFSCASNLLRRGV